MFTVTQGNAIYTILSIKQTLNNTKNVKNILNRYKQKGIDKGILGKKRYMKNLKWI